MIVKSECAEPDTGRWRRIGALVRLSVFVPALMMSGCSFATFDLTEDTAGRTLNDPFEEANRVTHDFNNGVREVMSPVFDAYNSQDAAPIKAGIGNLIGNLHEPVVATNDLLQGKDCAAAASVQRFIINSTVGIGGMIDVAEKDEGISGHDNGFSQTLGLWGVPAGPYLELPILGPSNFRGVAGGAVEYFYDPADRLMVLAGITGTGKILTGVDVSDKMASSQRIVSKLEKTSLDGYASMRSAWRQNQEEEMRNPHCGDNPR